MCNAWKHPPPGCTCGWGGEGHLGRRDAGHVADKALPLPIVTARTYWRIDSYTNPNAKCPVCGIRVYFYQSQNGRRVFFDELGPPWPKHPCTSKGSRMWAEGLSGKFPG